MSHNFHIGKITHPLIPSQEGRQAAITHRISKSYARVFPRSFGLEFMGGKRAFVGARKQNFVPAESSIAPARTGRTIEIMQRNYNERRPGIHRLDLLVRFGSSQNEQRIN